MQATSGRQKAKPGENSQLLGACHQHQREGGPLKMELNHPRPRWRNRHLKHSVVTPAPERKEAKRRRSLSEIDCVLVCAEGAAAGTTRRENSYRLSPCVRVCMRLLPEGPEGETQPCHRKDKSPNGPGCL